MSFTTHVILFLSFIYPGMFHRQPVLGSQEGPDLTHTVSNVHTGAGTGGGIIEHVLQPVCDDHISTHLFKEHTAHVRSV